MINENQPDFNKRTESSEAAQQSAAPQDPYAEISLPENSLLSVNTLAQFKQSATQVNLPAACLTKWLEVEENRLQEAQQIQVKQHEEQLEKWAFQTQKDWGDNWQEEVSKAVRAADAFGGPELRQLLEETGLGNHPVIVRTFHAVATQMSEDVSSAGVPSAQTDKTFTQALYGKN